MATTKTLGPWPKGLNLTNNRGSSVFLQDNELGDALNVTYTVEGFIEPRPGYKRYLYDFGTYDTIEVIGSLELPNGTVVTFVQTVTGTSPNRVAKVYIVTDKGTCSELSMTLSADTVFKHVMSYQSISANHSGVFLFADQLNKSIRNDRLDLQGTWSVISSNYAVPRSDIGFIVKDRLFLFDYSNSKMWWSPANYILDFNNYESVTSGYGSDGFSEEPIEATIPEDGIRTVQFLNNNFYIFKKTKGYMFTYQSLPGEDGYLRKFSDSLGAMDSVLFTNTIVLVNNRGVFRVDGTEFIDIQRQMNFRFEFPLDHSNVKLEDCFVTVYNDNILLGFNDRINDPHKSYYYLMSGKTGGWSQWSFDYAANISSPGWKHYKAQGSLTTRGILLTHTFDKRYLVYTDYKPGATLPHYHMDSDLTSGTSYTNYYIPPVVIKTAAGFGDSPIRFAKLYRTYMRFYMSDIPVDLLPPSTALWEISINYNGYQFNADKRLDGNPKFVLHPSNQEFADLTLRPEESVGDMAVYQRTYQIPIPQQRIKEFVVELKRKHNTITAEALSGLVNPDADRPIKHGYYFMLSAIWIDYTTKAGV